MKYIERKDYNKVITVKLVIPGGCNAKCPFCYNKDKDMSCEVPDPQGLLPEAGTHSI